MKTSRDSVSSLRSRLLIAPAIIGLLSLSFIAGYAGDKIWPSSSPERGRSGRLLLARHTPQDSGASKESAGDTAQDDPLESYKAAINLLKRDYYGAPIDAKKTRQLTYDAIRGMLATLKDPYTTFLDPEEWTQMQIDNRGDFEGIGAVLQPDGLDIRVVEPIENSPAEHVGIKANDIIVRVDGKSVIGKDLNDVVKMIKGKSGTQVRIGVLRGKTPMEFTIRRALVEPKVVKFWMEDYQYKIGHVVLTGFNEKSVEQLERAVSALEKQGMKALVFDLRFNPGGLLDAAIDVSSMFIPPDKNKALENAVVYVKEGTGKEQALTLRNLDSTHYNLPLVVLTNGMSASASEIVSGAIKDYGVGTIMGERTYGKGLVQTLFWRNLQGSALKLTTAKYYTPKHTDINRKRDAEGDAISGSGGILPDIDVKQSPKWKAEKFTDKVNDTQLQKAIEFLRARLSGKSVAQATEQLHATH